MVGLEVKKVIFCVISASDRNNKCTMVGFAVQIGIYVLHVSIYGCAYKYRISSL